MVDVVNTRCTVYGLRSSSDRRIRYVGQTLADLKARLQIHLCGARSGRVGVRFDCRDPEKRRAQSIFMTELWARRKEEEAARARS